LGKTEKSQKGKIVDYFVHGVRNIYFYEYRIFILMEKETTTEKRLTQTEMAKFNI